MRDIRLVPARAIKVKVIPIHKKRYSDYEIAFMDAGEKKLKVPNGKNQVLPDREKMAEEMG